MRLRVRAKLKLRARVRFSARVRLRVRVRMRLRVRLGNASIACVGHIIPGHDWDGCSWVMQIP